MNIRDVLENVVDMNRMNCTVVGIDIGSRQAKGVLLADDKIFCEVIPTGFFMEDTAEELLKGLCEQGNIERAMIQYIVVTGYGRVALQFADIPYQTITEIACHGKGAHFLAEDIHTVIDIGGQDSKVIRIDPLDGSVINFAMNDKCAAGTGRFLEKIANVLGYEVTDIGEASLKADKKIKINSTCVVFAESEVVSARAKGETPENLAAGIHSSVAKRVNGLLNRVGIESNVLFTGGVSNNVGMKKAFEDLLGVQIAESKLNTVFAGALGAAFFAYEYAQQNLPGITNVKSDSKWELNLEDYRKAIQETVDAYIHKTTGRKAYVAYTCNYTPIEILASANVSYIRLMHKGAADEIIAGENFTQSMQCDFTKSVLGGFLKKSPIYAAVERLYTFNTCACMRNALETVNSMGIETVIYNLPHRKKDSSSVEYLSSEMRDFKHNLEELTGEQISEKTIQENVKKYNQAKQKLMKAAEYRKYSHSPVSSKVFQELMYGYYVLPVDVLLVELQKILQQLEQYYINENSTNRIRLMLSGGILTNGDTKLTHILEDELDAEIIVEDNCTGIKPISYQIMENGEDVYHDLAAAYLGKAPCSRMYPVQEMLEYSLQLAKEYKVDGVVMYYLKFCPCYSMVEKLYRDMFRENHIPLLISSGDYSSGDEGQIKTRLEAYIEMIRVQKEGKKNG